MFLSQAQHVGPFKDSLEIKRKGSQACDATVTIYLDWQPERFTVDPKLADLIDLKWGTKAAVIRAFWASVKKHRLQDPKHPQQINLPMELAQVWMEWVQAGGTSPSLGGGLNLDGSNHLLAVLLIPESSRAYSGANLIHCRS